MVEILVENPIFTTKVVLNGDCECLDKIDDGLLLNERPRLPPFITGGIFGDLWSHTCETKVGCVVASWLDTRTWHFFFSNVSGTWNHTMRAKVLLPKIIADHNRRPSLYLSKLEVVR